MLTRYCRTFSGLVLALALGMVIQAPTAAGDIDVDITLAYVAPESTEFSSGLAAVIRAGGTQYLFASFSRHEQITLTQRMGSVQLFGAGVGIREQVTPAFRLYAEIGVGLLATDYNERVIREVVYYSFYPNFGDPPFLPEPGGWWSDLQQLYEPDDMAPIVRVGALYRLTEDVSLELSYTHFATDVYFSTWNPDIGGGPVPGDFDACGCLWEGTSELNLSGFAVGLNYQF